MEKPSKDETERKSKGLNETEKSSQSSGSKTDSKKEEGKLEATFSTLVLSVASSATISMGLAPHPSSEKIEKNFKMAQFNIDLLILLEKKTKNNLLSEEESFLRSIINDLQMKFVQAQS